MKYLLMLFGLIGAFLYLWGMRRNRPRLALLGIACIDLELGIITAMFLYALSGLVKPSKKDS